MNETRYLSDRSKELWVFDWDAVRARVMDTNLLQTALAERDEAAQPVIKKVRKPGTVAADALHGRFGVEREADRRLAEILRQATRGRSLHTIDYLQYGRFSVHINGGLTYSAARHHSPPSHSRESGNPLTLLPCYHPWSFPWKRESTGRRGVRCDETTG